MKQRTMVVKSARNRASFVGLFLGCLLFFFAGAALADGSCAASCKPRKVHFYVNYVGFTLDADDNPDDDGSFPEDPGAAHLYVKYLKQGGDVADTKEAFGEGTLYTDDGKGSPPEADFDVMMSPCDTYEITAEATSDGAYGEQTDSEGRIFVADEHEPAGYSCLTIGGRLDDDGPSCQSLTISDKNPVSAAFGVFISAAIGKQRTWTAVLTGGGGCQNQQMGSGGETYPTMDEGGVGSGDNGSTSGPVNGYSANFSLGSDSTANSFGTLGWNLASITSDIFTPASLAVNSGSTGLTQVISLAGVLRQIHTPKGLADIVAALDGSGFTLSFYDSAGSVGTDGLYSIVGSPTKTWTVSNAGGAGTVTITTVAGGNTTTQIIGNDSTAQKWSVTSGAGMLQQTTTRTVSTDSNGDQVETVEITDSASHTLSKEATTFHLFAWGRQKIRTVVDPDGAALTTNWTYYQDSADTNNYTRVWKVQNSDGSWHIRTYGPLGIVATELNSWKDVPLASATQANCRVIYRTMNGASTSSLTYIEGQQVAQNVTFANVYLYEDQPAMLFTNRDYLSPWQYLKTITITYTEDAPAALAGKVGAVGHPGTYDTYRLDDTLESTGPRDLYSYQYGTYAAGTGNGDGAFTAGTGSALQTTIVHCTAGGTDQKSTQDISVTDEHGRDVLDQHYVFTGSQFELVSQKQTLYDTDGNMTSVVTGVTGNSRPVYSSSWQSGQKVSETDETGVETDYTYYPNTNLIHTSTKKGVAGVQADIVTTYSYDGFGRQTDTVVSAGSLSQGTHTEYYPTGQLKRTVDTGGLETRYTYGRDSSGHPVTTVTFPNTATEIDTSYLDQQLKSVSGTAVEAKAYDYIPTQAGLQTATLKTGSMTIETRDWGGHILAQLSPGYGGQWIRTVSDYDNGGNRKSQTTGPIITSFAYDAYNNLISTTRNGIFQGTETTYENLGGTVYQTTQVTGNAPSGGTTALQVVRNVLNNFGSSVVSKTTTTDAYGQDSVDTMTLNRGAKTITETVSRPGASMVATRVTINGLLVSATSNSVSTAVQYTYDDLGRPKNVTDSRGAVTKRDYDPTTGWVSATTDAANQVTLIEYYQNGQMGAGKVKKQTQPDGTTLQFEYDLRDNIIHEYGTAVYPLRRAFDAAGRMVALQTFRSGENGSADTTRWNYDPASGLLLSKVDAAGKAVSYTYDVAGRVATRTWARGVMTTYSYADGFGGGVSQISYSDGTVPVTMNYDTLGNLSGGTDASGAFLQTNTLDGRFQSQTWTDGLFKNVAVEVGVDDLGRRQSLQVSRKGAIAAHRFDYDSTTGRLQTVSMGNLSATYGYESNSDLLTTTTLKNGGTTVLTNARHYDGTGRLDWVTANGGSNNVLESYNYSQYSSTGQRQRADMADGSHWQYGYNSRGEVISGSKYLSNDTSSPETGYQFAYGFDTIGNRTSASHGGNGQGHNFIQESYTPNRLNQYVAQSVPGLVDVLGSANAGAAVAVNGQAANRQGTLYSKTLAVDNNAGPVSLPVSVTATGTPSGASQPITVQQNGFVLVPPARRTFIYDDDGNLTNDGLWIYTWDGENRLNTMENVASIPASNRTRLEFAYDSRGRRIAKKVYTSQNGNWQLSRTIYFVSDSWNLIAECDAEWSLRRSFVWGQDLSGTLNEAGGVGGLLAICTQETHPPATLLPTYDGSGNVLGLFNAANGARSATYEYGPFGESTRRSGLASVNPFQFSTKYLDLESGLVYYGYRYLDVSAGRWLNRDPLEENGGENLFAFVKNAYGSFDALGEFGLAGAIEPSAPMEDGKGFVLSMEVVRRSDLRNWMEQQLRAKGWKISTGGDTELPGTFTITHNQPLLVLAENRSGGDFAGLLSTDKKPVCGRRRWLQYVTTDAPTGRTSGSFFDDGTANLTFTPGEGNFLPPFYPGTQPPRFADSPSRYYAALPYYPMSAGVSGEVSWNAYLFVADVDEKQKSVVLYDGLEWGWRRQRTDRHPYPPKYKTPFNPVPSPID
jgi:RHS repeat-associated protein